ncbi:MAG: hypothetical protein K2K46_07760 [Lachnospiraceae bacterium]|nr:hypothetical protein [Lachnospiraceae bacterium]
MASFSCSRRPLYNIDNINAGTLALHVARSGAKLENTSLSTDGSIVPAYEIVYIVQLGFENNLIGEDIKYVRYSRTWKSG